MNATPEARGCPPPRLLLASANPHKRKELARLLRGCELLSPPELGLGFEGQEQGRDFRDNALAKALALLALLRSRGGSNGVLGVLADDSGLCVDALEGRPGVRSNRYGSNGGSLLEPRAKIELLLEELRGTSERSARFVCALAFVLTPERFFLVQETMEGSIAERAAGEGGFGYDPVFVVPGKGCTVAQLTDAQKDALSHRGRAARRMQAIIASLAAEP